MRRRSLPLLLAPLLCLAGGLGTLAGPADDPLPPGALARLGTTRFRHGRYVFQAAFSPNGRLVASAGMPQGVCLWDAATGKKLHAFLPWSVVNHVAFSPDGKLLAAGVNPVLLWDVATGKEVRRIQVPGDDPHLPFAFSPDGKALATGATDGSVRVWDVATGRELRTLRGHERAVPVLAFSPDGRTLASGSLDQTVRLWNWSAGNEAGRLVGCQDTVFALGFSPGGKVLASGSLEGSVRLWEAATGRPLRVLREKGYRIGCVAFSPDGTLLAAAGGDYVRVWEAATGKLVRRWRAHPDLTAAVAFSPDGTKLVSCGRLSSALRFWDVATGKEVGASGGHRAPVEQVGFSADGRHVFSAARDQTLRRWDRGGGGEKVLFSWKGRGAPSGFAFSADGALVAAIGPRHEVHLWAAAGGRGRRLPGPLPDEPVAARLVFSPDGRLLAWPGKGRAVHLWDVAAARERGRLAGVGGDVLSLALSPDAGVVAVATWEAEAPGRPAAGAVRLWDVRQGRVLRPLATGLDDGWDRLVFSPDGAWLASAGRGCLWEVGTGKELRPADVPADRSLVAFSADGRLQAWGGRHGAIHLLESATGRELLRFPEASSELGALAFSPEGRRLVAGYSDSTILVWDVTGGLLAAGRSQPDLTRADLEARWADLAGPDAAKAHRALWLLAAVPRQSVAFLKDRLRPVQAAEPGRLDRLIADLGGEQFRVRTRASRELAQLGDLAEPALRRAVAANPPLEVRRRAEQLLNELWGPVTAPQRLRPVRAVAVLEQVGTPEARRVLRALAGGAPEARLTREARAALERLAGQAAAGP